MDIYSALCCFKSRKWHRALKPLFLEQHYDISNTNQELSRRCIDSYLGRLLSAVLVINKSIADLTADNFNLFLEVRELMCSSVVIVSKNYQPRMQATIRSYLSLNLPAVFVQRYIEYGMLGLATREGKDRNLNDPLFYNILIELSKVEYEPIKHWFDLHPEYLKESDYDEEGDSKCRS